MEIKSNGNNYSLNMDLSQPVGNMTISDKSQMEVRNAKKICIGPKFKIQHGTILRFVEFCLDNGCVIGDTNFPHKNNHKLTWNSSDCQIIKMLSTKSPRLQQQAKQIYKAKDREVKKTARRDKRNCCC